MVATVQRAAAEPIPSEREFRNVTRVTSKSSEIALYCVWGKERSMDEEKTMATKTITSDDEVAILNVEIPDELLESTAQSGEMCAFTLGSCTGLSVCPG